MELNDATLAELMRLHDKVKAGEELTAEEQVWLEEFVVVFTKALQPLLDVLKEVVHQIVSALQAFWNSLPEETRTLLMEQSVDVVKSTVQEQVVNYGIPSTQQSMQQAVSADEVSILSRISQSRRH